MGKSSVWTASIVIIISLDVSILEIREKLSNKLQKENLQVKFSMSTQNLIIMQTNKQIKSNCCFWRPLHYHSWLTPQALNNFDTNLCALIHSQILFYLSDFGPCWRWENYMYVFAVTEKTGHLCLFRANRRTITELCQYDNF